VAVLTVLGGACRVMKVQFVVRVFVYESVRVFVHERRDVRISVGVFIYQHGRYRCTSAEAMVATSNPLQLITGSGTVVIFS